MATRDAIAATSNAILGLLKSAKARPQPELLDADYKLFHARDFETVVDGFRGVSLYLYRVAINGTVRNAPRRRIATDGHAFTELAPLPLDLSYLLTAWDKDVDLQQRLLGWCMRALHDTPIVPATFINNYTHDTTALPFRPGETIELVCESLSFQDMTTLWDKLKPKMQTSITYVARMVMIESDMEMAEAGPVQTRAFETAKMVDAAKVAAS